MSSLGVEPSTLASSGRRSTVELKGLMAGTVGLEPTTIPLTGERSTIELHTNNGAPTGN